MSDGFNGIDELNDIVRNPGKFVEFSKLESNCSKDWIRRRFDIFCIYTAALGNDQHMSTAIEVFEREYMGTVPNQMTGKLDSVVLLAMNKAFGDEQNWIPSWRRQLSFYGKDENKAIYYFPYVMDDMDMNNTEVFVPQLSGKEIFAKERDLAEFSLGKVVHYDSGTAQFFGMQRFATERFYYQHFSTSMEKVIYAVAWNEGGNPANGNRRVGGYDTVNSYDGVFLSVGLFHWNRDPLWELMMDYKEKSPSLYEEFSDRLGIDAVKIRGDKHFTVNGTPYRMNNLEVLRRLKYVYLFLREAEKREFREAQDRAASSWVKRALDSKLDEEDRNSPKLREYITSELAVALYVDMTVFKGEAGGAGIAREAIGSVLRKIADENLEDNSEDFPAVQEKLVVDALKKSMKKKFRRAGYLLEEI